MQKRLGRRVNLRTDWEQIKNQIMYEICLCKFTQNPDLKIQITLNWGPRIAGRKYLGDYYWGVCNGLGQNQLGKTLMQIRKILKRK